MLICYFFFSIMFIFHMPFSISPSLIHIHHRRLLQRMTQLLKLIAANSQVNKMTTHNLAICFGPSILRPETETMESSIREIPIATEFIARLIMFTTELFWSKKVTNAILIHICIIFQYFCRQLYLSLKIHHVKNRKKWSRRTLRSRKRF